MDIKQAILPVAGLGTRFLPWTKVVPKELLPMGNEPIIAKLVDECLSIGIEEICFVISKGKELIPRYFQEDSALKSELERRGKTDLLSKLKKYDGVRFHVVYQKDSLGDGHAIMQAADWVTGEHVAILFGDDLIVHERSGLRQLLDAFDQVPTEDRERAAMLCLQNVAREKTSSYGIVELAEGAAGPVTRIAGMVEKPKPDVAPSTLGIVGKYIIPRSTLAVLPEVASAALGAGSTEVRLIDALIHQVQAGMPVYGCQFEGTRLDTGTPEGYKEAVQLLG